MGWHIRFQIIPRITPARSSCWAPEPQDENVLVRAELRFPARTMIADPD